LEITSGVTPEALLGTENLTCTEEAVMLLGKVAFSLIVISTLYWLTVWKKEYSLKGALKSEVIL
jgi:hypothetical protein